MYEKIIGYRQRLIVKDFYLQIEDYLSGALSAEAKMEFEEALRRDPALAKAVAEQDVLRRRLEAMRVREKVRQALDHQAPPSFRWRPFAGLAAAVLLLLLGIGYFLQQRSAAALPNPDPLPYPAPPPVSAPPPTLAAKDTPLIRPEKRPPIAAVPLAQSFYLRKDAIQLRSPATDSNENDPEERLYHRAQMDFDHQRFAAAEKTFQQLSQGFQFRYEAQWNAMLCRLAQGKPVLPQLRQWKSDADFPFRAKADSLYRQMK